MKLIVLYVFIVNLFQIFGWRFEPCSEKNFQGVCETIEGNGCINLEDVTWFNEVSMLNSINSIRSVDNCVRLFDGHDCEEKSQAFYPRARGLNDLDLVNFANATSSVGPCLEYECANKNINHGEFACISHDNIWLGVLKNLTSVEIKDDDNPIIKYQVGFNNRVEFVQANITVRHLNKGSKPDNDTITFISKMGKPGDLPGMIIGEHLGGRGSLLYNVFPQNPYIAMSMYRDLLNRIIYSFIYDNNVILNINLYYENEKSTRPLALIFKIKPHFFTMRHLINPLST